MKVGSKVGSNFGLVIILILNFLGHFMEQLTAKPRATEADARKINLLRIKNHRNPCSTYTQFP